MFRKKGSNEVEIARENEIKIRITQELSTALKMVQKENVCTDDQTIYSTDTANSVCNCLEAVFLHGLKSKAVTKIANYVGLGQEATTQASLNFWNFVSCFTHGEVISQLKHLGQITTEIGLCRAWVRVALNDGIMESYIDAMVSDKKNLEYCYHRTAYLRDREQPGIMKTYLQGLMNFEFKLSYNASVLNEWAYAPLLLAGIINSKDAPPPIIKPAVLKPTPSSSSHQDRHSNTVVEVFQNKSKSCDGSFNPDKRGSTCNPMEQPNFGPPSDSSFYVSSSEFTSKDVEDFKRISMNIQMPLSDCSGSSHMSAPDLPCMNLSPATYVLTYGVPTGSPSSYKTHESDHEEKDISHAESTAKERIDSGNSFDIYNDTKFDSELKSTLTLSNIKKGRIVQNLSSEESWEDSDRYTVKELQNKDTNFWGVKRLDSINRELKEKAILNSIEENENIPQTEKWNIEQNEKRKLMSNEKEGNLVEEEGIPSDVIEKKNKEVDTYIDTHNGSLIYDSNKENTAGTDTLLDVSQKLLDELGIEDQCNTQNVEADMNEKEKSKQEMLKTRSKIKTSSGFDRLKPKLNLNPPMSNIVEADLSDAVAITVNQIRTLENPDYLSKHRLSLPSATIVAKTDKNGPRKSLPNVLEHVSENGEDTKNSIEDHLYDGLPLDEGRDCLFRGIDEDYKTSAEKSTDKGEDEKGDSFCPPKEALKRLNEKRTSLGNNLMMTGRGWSSSFDSETDDTMDTYISNQSNISLPITREKSESFGSLLQNYTPASSLSARSIDDVLCNLPNRKDTIYSTGNLSSSVNEDTDNLEGFEVVTSNSTDIDLNDMSRLIHFSNIANEKGLDAQNFQCYGCSRAIGLIFGKPRVCKFDGGYYCYECHENDEYYIPAQIAHNWDFRKHKVAKKNLEFVMDKEEQPYLNIDEINPRLYEHVLQMQEMKNLRLQLMLLKTYLFTCKQSVAEDLQKLVWPKDYLYECTELYSLAVRIM